MGYFKSAILSFTFIFHALNAAWSPPEEVSGSGINSSPQIAMDTNGNAVAVWVSAGAILSADLPFDGTWSEPTPLYDLTYADFPQVSVGADGTAVAVWRSSGYIYSAIRPPGENWGTAVSISELGPYPPNNPQVAVDGNGNAVAVWVLYDEFQDKDVTQSATFFEGSWSSPVVLPAVNHDRNPQVAITPNGHAVAVWYSEGGIYSATLPIGESWGSPILVSNDPWPDQNPQVAIDANGNATAVWSAQGKVYTATLLFGEEEWSDSVHLSPYSVAATSPQVAVYPDGSAIAVWQESDGTNTVICSTNFFEGSTTGIFTLSNSGQNSSEPQVTVDANGNAVAIWSSTSDSTYPIIQTRTLLFDSEWDSGESFSSEGFDANSSQVAAAGNKFVAIWRLLGGDSSVIQSSYLILAPEPPLTPLPPSNFRGVVVKNKFLNKTEHVLTARWGASPSPDVVSYKIRKGGKVVKVFKSNHPLVFVEKIHKKATLNYTITAVNSFGLESDPIHLEVYP